MLIEYMCTCVEVFEEYDILYGIVSLARLMSHEPFLRAASRNRPLGGVTRAKPLSATKGDIFLEMS